MQLVLPNGQAYPLDGVLRFADVTVDPTDRARWSCAPPSPIRDGVLLPGLYVRARVIEGVLPQGLLAPQAGITHNERGQATALVVGPGNVVAQRDRQDRPGGGRQVGGHRAASGPAIG